MKTQHCRYWCPGAKAPGHSNQQGWLNIDSIWLDSYRHITFLGNDIRTRQIWGICDSCDRPSNLTQIGFKSSIFFSLRDLTIWWMTSTNNGAPLLYYIKLCASFQIQRWIQTRVTVRKRSIRVKIGEFLSGVTLKYHGWPWNTIGHLFYTKASFVHCFKAMGEFKLELQFRNYQFGSKSASCMSPVNLKFDRWPWTRQIWGIW